MPRRADRMAPATPSRPLIGGLGSGSPSVLSAIRPFWPGSFAAHIFARASERPNIFPPFAYSARSQRLHPFSHLSLHAPHTFVVAPTNHIRFFAFCPVDCISSLFRLQIIPLSLLVILALLLSPTRKTFPHIALHRYVSQARLLRFYANFPATSSLFS
jgi:hypothetical protein